MQTSSFLARGVETVIRAADAVLPMNASQRRDLPAACRDLSRLLTQERDLMGRSYWTSPRDASAYLRYFLPWNLLRFSCLAEKLRFAAVPEKPVLLDIGSGPLSFPMALWLCRADLRKLPVRVICTDTAPQPLKYGRKIFSMLREELDPASEWDVETIRCDIRNAASCTDDGIWLATFGNVLNEAAENVREDRLKSLFRDLAERLVPGGSVLCVEPGTRQGARVLRSVRACCLGEADGEEDFAGSDEDNSPILIPCGPCTHLGRCPLGAHAGQAWCHFNQPVTGVPKSLAELSNDAGLGKDGVSYAWLRLCAEDSRSLHEKSLKTPARIISDAFAVPGLQGRARYACSEKGLLLIEDCASAASGVLVEAVTDEEGRRDRKSRALLARIEKHAGSRMKEKRKASENAAGNGRARPPKSIPSVPDRKKHRDGRDSRNRQS